MLFAYPIFVVIITTVITRQPPSARVLLALLMTTLGVVLVTGALNARLTASQWSGMAWILFCSLSIAIYTLISGELTQRLGSGCIYPHCYDRGRGRHGGPLSNFRRLGECRSIRLRLVDARSAWWSSLPYYRYS